MDKYQGYTPEGETIKLIEKVKEKMRSEISDNEQVRPKEKSFLGFLGSGADKLSDQSNAAFFKDIFQELKGVNS